MTTIPPNLLDEVSRLALVGVAKNCGKTTTLNFLLGSPACADRCVGLVSIGIDGESADLLIGTKKPPIHVKRGHWIVTARDALAKSTARVEYVESLGFSTPLGEVLVGRVIEEGTVVLAGVRHRGDLRKGIDVLEKHGVDLVLIDGAYGRTVAAKAELSDALIVSTGAVLSSDVDEICARTAQLVDRLALAEVEEDWQRELLGEAISQDRSLLGGQGVEPVELPSKSALLGLKRAGALWTEEIEAIAIPGLVSDSVVEHLLAVTGKGRMLLVPDGTVLQASARRLGRLERRWQVRALQPARILALSINPSGIQGHRVDAAALAHKLRERWPQICVFNPLHSAAAHA
ncbi:hypothetical protein FIV42_08625 [Persicimonas caeni]|uniref:Uncharacterized protein n=1 Tax=Persicimonas caeni TaxID=2292766 RepID=A0A4Y6PR35_PERCE|nr:hypothetical protein [Persicimonas caeni]QDG50791.1 hypothetical protein FIV42_08625 [Persicimonas caeni]QED32012.1 hypothetical protein FRD00_08620 [Persicimonas caeni]